MAVKVGTGLAEQHGVELQVGWSWELVSEVVAWVVGRVL